MTEKSYRIVGLHAENVKRLRAIDLTPRGHVIEVTGKNRNGKSSLLDSVAMALGGKDLIPDMPIRRGEKKAQIIVELNGLIVKRTMNAQEDGTYTTSLTVETADGMQAKKPQDFLNALIGELSFDPLAFANMKPKEQFDILKRFVPDYDFDGAATNRKRIFDERTLVNKQIKDAQGVVASATIPDGTPDKEIDVSALTDELQAIGVFNAEIERRRSNRDRVRSDIEAKRAGADRKTQEALELRRRADLLDQEAADLLNDATALQDKLDEAGPLPDAKDPADIRAKINEAHTTNEQVRQKVAIGAKIEEVRRLQEKSNQLTKDIEAIDEAKAKAIASSLIPVEGISFGDDSVYLNGVPFDQASSAEQISAALSLAVAANPKLRVVLIREGSLLDSEAFELLRKLAEEKDIQIFIEVVESKRPGALIIEDGELRAPIAEAAE